MKVETLHDLAVRLCEGGAVWFEGHTFVAIELPDVDDACYCCHLDSICNENIKELCMECDALVGKNHCLNLWECKMNIRNKRE